MSRPDTVRDQDPSRRHVFLVGTGESPISCSEAREILRVRRSRGDHFPPGLFADPVWDILLHLYATELAGQRSCVTDATHVANVSEATALRRLAGLITAGLCRKEPDPTDRRRQFVKLTVAGKQSMDNYFATLRAEVPKRIFSEAA